MNDSFTKSLKIGKIGEAEQASCIDVSSGTGRIIDGSVLSHVADRFALGCDEASNRTVERTYFDFSLRSSKTGLGRTLEVKTDSRALQTNNLAVEIITNMERDIRGWCNPPRSDIYVFFMLNATHEPIKAVVVTGKALNELVFREFPERRNRFRTVYDENHRQKIYLLPIREVLAFEKSQRSGYVKKGEIWYDSNC